ncbi:MAG: PHP domain-containing protein [Promethearchaeota archaeon]|jgi:predicted metal-dependent phosphoesterase TrpH
MIDLHLHSISSDGQDTPSQIVDKAMELNLKAIALTDHDTISGLGEFLSYGEEKNIIVIPGIELSIKHEPERELRDVHIIGLNIDHRSTKVRESIEDQIKGRLEQKRAICNRLRSEFGFNISFNEVQEIAGSSIIGRPHIVEIMIRNNPNLTKGKTKNQLFKLISLGGSAYVDRVIELNLENSIELILSAGGIPILAHPGIYNNSNYEHFIEMLIEAGIKGIEVEYTYSKNRPFYETKEAIEAQKTLPDYFRKIAEKYKLIKSGGSDYHGGKKGIQIGEANVPNEYLKSFI